VCFFVGSKQDCIIGWTGQKDSASLYSGWRSLMRFSKTCFILGSIISTALLAGRPFPNTCAHSTLWTPPVKVWEIQPWQVRNQQLLWNTTFVSRSCVVMIDLQLMLLTERRSWMYIRGMSAAGMSDADQDRGSVLPSMYKLNHLRRQECTQLSHVQFACRTAHERTSFILWLCYIQSMLLDWTFSSVMSCLYCHFCMLSHTTCLKNTCQLFLLCVCQIWTDFNKDCRHVLE